MFTQQLHHFFALKLWFCVQYLAYLCVCVCSRCPLCTSLKKLPNLRLLCRVGLNLEESQKLKLPVQFVKRMCNTHLYTCDDVCAVTWLFVHQDDCFHSRLRFNQVSDGFQQVHKHTVILSSLSHFLPVAKHTQSRQFSILQMWHQTVPVWETTMLPSSATHWPCQGQAASSPGGIRTWTCLE